MNYILIIGTFEAFFLVLLLISKKEKVKSDFFLGVILGLYGISIFLSYIEIHNIQNNFPFPQIININWLVLFLHGPALWFYIKSLSSHNIIFKPIYILHFLPFFVFLVFHYFNFIGLPNSEKIIIAKNELFRDNIFYKISIISIGLSTITYNLWALILIKNYDRRLKHFYSKTDSIDLKWLQILTISSLSVYLLNVAIVNLNLMFHFTSHKIVMMTTYSFASIYVLVIGFFGLQQKNVFLAISNKKYIKPAKHKPIKNDESNFIEKLRLFMEENKPFLDSDINLLKLSKLLKVKTDYLSEILNMHMHQTFFDFINKYRIEEFKKQCSLGDNKHLSILGIAYNCGFNSKASFYRAFKKFEQISPSSYIKNVS
ncbi:MAG: helix-turn-helix domain-containing protein [Melioribacteraceae bacterium]|nr:helix-turn-helix domain-containing protein [Melioribacteraceae bacterium]